MKKGTLLSLLLLVLLALSACSQTASGTTKTDASETPPAEEATETGETTEDVKLEEAAENSESAEETGTEEAVSDKDTAEETEKPTDIETASEEKAAEAETVPTEENTDSTVAESVWLYFSDDQLMNVFRVEEKVTASNEGSLPKAALERWIQGPSTEGLYNLMPEDVEVLRAEAGEYGAVVSFSAELLAANLGSTGEMFFIEQVAMIMQQFGYSQTKILIDGKEVETFFGHIDGTEPVVAGSPDDYQIK